MTKQYECADGFKLGFWLSVQRIVRQRYAQENALGRAPGNLTEEKIARLDAIGMTWEGKGNDRFDEYLRAFLKYKVEHDDAIIPACYVDVDGCKLGQWASRMRHQYFARKLPEGKKARLTDAGFPFDGISIQWW